MKGFLMIENMEKKVISGSRSRAQLLFACLLLCLGGGARATEVASAGNDFVTITVEADYPITIALDENDFYIGTEDDSVEVTVEAVTDQILEIPDPNTFILGAGESKDYETKPEPNETLEGDGTIYFPKVDLNVTLEDEEVNGVRSGLDEDTLVFDLNGNVIPKSALTLTRTTETVDGVDITTELNVEYTPSCDELVVPGSNTLKVDIDDNVDNHMDQISETFSVPTY